MATQQPFTSADDTPRIYVACLAAYNNGRLHGRWIDADQPADDIWAEVQEMLATSPEPGAEEWAIHDYEGFGGLRLSEWESFDRVAAIAGGIARHGLAFASRQTVPGRVFVTVELPARSHRITGDYAIGGPTGTSNSGPSAVAVLTGVPTPTLATE